MGTKLGQVFLHDANILRKIIASAELTPESYCVEIGCGDGILTEALSDQARHLTVFEIDELCITKTKARIGNRSNVTFISGDFLETSHLLATIDGPITIVANVPYYITSPIIKHLIPHLSRLKNVILMVQKEFATKLISPPGDALYTSFSVYTSAHFKVDRLFNVSRHCFYPVPNVDSSVIQLTPNPIEIPGDPTLFFAMVHSGFWGRRKPLQSALSKSPYIKMATGYRDCTFFQTHPGIRAESLSLQAFIQLFSEISPFISLDTTSNILPS
jgi:16S rRNA (adenine1518-N6/adenine1519-N6)-dimethyltransferase